MTDKHKKLLYACGVAVFILLGLAVAYFIGKPMIKYISQPERFRALVDSHGVLSRLAMIGMIFAQVVVALIPGEPFELGAGYAFGAVEGTLLCIVGIAAGSAAVFFFVRRFGRTAVEVFFPREKIDSLRFIRDSKNLNLLVFIIFLIPGTPKDLLTYFIGLTKMKFGTWMLITMTARLPSVITSTVGGDALGTKNYAFAATALCVTAAVSAAGILIYRNIILPKRSGKSKPGDQIQPVSNNGINDINKDSTRK